MSRKIVLETKAESIDTTPYIYPTEIRIGKRHTTMPITKYNDKSTVIRNKAQRQEIHGA